MLNLLKVALLSILPISELRGGIPLGLTLGLSPTIVFVAATLSNLLAIPIAYFFLDNIHSRLLRYGKYKRFFGNYIHKKREKIESKIGTKAEFIALLIFTAIPAPGTGAWTGSILAWFFNVKRKKAYLAISFGVFIAGIIVTLASLGLIALF